MQFRMILKIILKKKGSSGKQQATSNKLDLKQDPWYRIIKEKVMRESKYSFLYKAYDGSIMRPESFLNINKGRTLSSSQLRLLRIEKIKNESFKRQAASVKPQAIQKNLHKPGTRVKNRFNRKI